MRGTKGGEVMGEGFVIGKVRIVFPRCTFLDWLLRRKKVEVFEFVIRPGSVEVDGEIVKIVEPSGEVTMSFVRVQGREEDHADNQG
jgi:hypothetical protein